MHKPNIQLIQGDCLEKMNDIPDGSVDLILTDPPYGTTACSWDSIIPFDPMWKHIKRIIKDKNAILLFGAEPFSSVLRCSNLDMYKYNWIWKKSIGSNFLNAKNAPLKKHELISVFSHGTIANKSNRRMVYNPQGIVEINAVHKRPTVYITDHNMSRPSHKPERIITHTGYPDSILDYPQGNHNTIHPTQKPVPLLEYLIQTYTYEYETVLDFTMGSGSTGIACLNLNRNFIGIELNEKYFNLAVSRINDHIVTEQPKIQFYE